MGFARRRLVALSLVAVACHSAPSEKQAFDHIDTNRDGKITREEFAVMLEGVESERWKQAIHAGAKQHKEMGGSSFLTVKFAGNEDTDVADNHDDDQAGTVNVVLQSELQVQIGKA